MSRILLIPVLRSPELSFPGRLGTTATHPSIFHVMFSYTNLTTLQQKPLVAENPLVTDCFVPLRRSAVLSVPDHILLPIASQVLPTLRSHAPKYLLGTVLMHVSRTGLSYRIFKGGKYLCSDCERHETGVKILILTG